MHNIINDFCREEDVDRAIQASLSVMSEEKMKKSEKPKEERVSPVTTISNTESDFPTLGNISVAALKPSRSDSPIDSDHRDSDSERKSDSLAKRLAMKSSQSVQHGGMSLNDFPSLHDDTHPLSSGAPLKMGTVVTKPSASVSKSVSDKPIMAFDKRFKSGPVREEDFPGLPTASKRAATKGLTMSWTKTTQSKPTPSIQVIVNKPPVDNEAKTSKLSNKNLRKKTFDSDSDFPTLGKRADNGGSSGWLKQVNEPKPPKPKEKEFDWFEYNDSDEFNVDNLKGDKDNKQLIEDSISKNNKKKKKKKPKTDDPASKSQTNDVNKETDSSTLDTIAFSLLSEAPERKISLDDFTKELNGKSEEVAPKYAKHDVKASSQTKVSQSNSVQTDQKEDFPSLPKTAKSEKLKTVPSESSTLSNSSKSFAPYSDSGRGFAPNNMEDFPSLSGAVGKSADGDTSRKMENVHTQPSATSSHSSATGKQSLNDSDDFPSLSSAVGTTSKAPPPGFASTKSGARAPPGFNKSSSAPSSRPPPGFASMATTAEMGDNSSSLSLKNILSVSMAPSEMSIAPSEMPLTTDFSNFEYAQPEDFTTRNRALITRIQDSFAEDSDKFDKFKTWSGEFRKGNITASDYYEKCESLVGEEKFHPIFSELLALLPDIGKQQELLKAYSVSESKPKSTDYVLSISGKSKDAPWSKKQTQFQSCPTCRQVLLPTDYDKHVSSHSHSQETDFPALGGKASTASGPGMRAWLKAKWLTAN